MAAAEESRKLLCRCGKQIAVFDVRGLQLYCRYSKETTTVPYGLAGLAEAIAFVEGLRRQSRQPRRGPRVKKNGR
jgi:hypothetical protein